MVGVEMKRYGVGEYWGYASTVGLSSHYEDCKPYPCWHSHLSL